MTLSKQYDRLYANEVIAAAEEVPPVRPLHFAGWPTDRNQALIFMARRGGRLLEIGCGQGAVLATLAPDYDAVVGTELSPVRAERARRGLAHIPNARVVTADLDELQRAGEAKFDCVIWADVIEHIVDVRAALAAIAALCNPGAWLVTVTPNVAFLPQRLNVLRGRAPNTALPWFPDEGFTADHAQTVLMDAGHVHYFTYRQVEILYRLAGFTPQQRLGIGTRWSRLRNWWPTLLSGQVCVAGRYGG